MQQPYNTASTFSSPTAACIPKSPQPTAPYLNAQTFQSYIDLLTDQDANDESKLKAAQELSNNFEVSVK